MDVSFENMTLCFKWFFIVNLATTSPNCVKREGCCVFLQRTDLGPMISIIEKQMLATIHKEFPKVKTVP